LAASQERIHSLDALRGLAALAVAWYHFTNSGTFKDSGWLSASGAYGYLGVTAFFVISGTVIPYSLRAAGYSLRNFPVFLGKRLVRLDPPYLASIALLLALGYLSTLAPGYQGQPFHVNWTQVLLHLGYLNAFVDPVHGWLNVVFWTLAVEFQFYLLAGLLYPLAASPARLVRLGFFSLFCAPAFFFHTDTFIFTYAFVFALGFATFQYKAGVIGRREYLTLVCVFLAGAVLTVGPAKAVGAGVAVAAINFAELRARALLLLGTVSYSVYLLHVPVGGRAINLGGRFAGTAGGRLAVCLGALAVTLAASYVFYRLAERPSQLLSSKIKYRRPAEFDYLATPNPRPS
jgi:peptidoglycan/LPS O-acetylase OafA/YrhL